MQDASVLGKTFTLQAAWRRSRGTGGRVEALLASLVRKEITLYLRPTATPERGQYGFLQDLVKQVAYETLSKQGAEERSTSRRPGFSERVAGRRRDRRGRRGSLPRRVRRGPDAEDAGSMKEEGHATLARRASARPRWRRPTRRCGTSSMRSS